MNRPYRRSQQEVPMTWSFGRAGWGAPSGEDDGPTRWGLTTVIRTILDVVPGGVIRAGKSAYTDDADTGFWLGVDSDGLAKLNLGSAAFYLKWTGTMLEIAGSLRTRNSYVEIIDDSAETYGEGITLLQGDWLSSGALRWRSAANKIGAILTGVNSGTAGSTAILYVYPRTTGTGNVATATIAAYNKAIGEAGADYGGFSINSNKTARITGELEITGNTKNDVQLLIWCPADQAVDIIQVLDEDENEKLSLDHAGVLAVAGGLEVGGVQVVGAQQAAIAGVAETGSAEDGAARAKINEILGALRAHGLIES
jgi:hypothetical protein